MVKPVPIVIGHRYTLFSCSSSAMTQRQEITVHSILETPQFRPAYVGASTGRYRLGSFKISRKRAMFYLDVDLGGTLVILGWDLGILSDHEAYNPFAMSATINLAATPDAIRELVSKNINDNFLAHDTIISYQDPLSSGKENGILVYPDAPTQHAVIERMREATA